MRKLWEWASGWYNTLAIKYRNPGLYEFLKTYKYDPADFEEVPGTRIKVHKGALERMRKLGKESP